ncbi:MAG TPA: ThiF family adenylyltransferase [Kofleriaceae bacterium]
MKLRATLVGAGGLGGPIALALGAAGIELVIADDDIVELSNLQRQIQFTSADLGQPKAARLAELVESRGGLARPVAARWTEATADELGDDAAIVIDASDDPATKFAVADWAVASGRCYVIAAALRYGGNVMAGAPGAACYRCLFEAPVEAPSCADAGVLGPVVGAIGGVAAAVALGLVHGDRALAGALLVFDDLRRASDPRIVRFVPRKGCPACARAPISPSMASSLATPVRVAENR